MKICVLGHLATGVNAFDGQTIKARNLIEGFKKYSDFEITEIDSYNWKKHPLKLVSRMRNAVRTSDAVIMLPAHNGVKIFARILSFLAKNKNVKLFYNVIGGWLPAFLKKRKSLSKVLRRFDGIWVETRKMETLLREQGFCNVTIIRNFKFLEIVPYDKAEIHKREKRYCIFSRINRMKGVTDAIEVFAEINGESEQTCFLDIYGMVDEEYKDEFFGLIEKNKEFVRYCGAVDPRASTEIIGKYYGLLFPTHYIGEGIPGTIIDALYSETPVVASMWENYSDILSEKCAMLYNFGDKNGLKRAVTKMNSLSLSEYLNLTREVAENRELFTPEHCMTEILSAMGITSTNR